MSGRQLRPRSADSISLDATNDGPASFTPSTVTPRKRQKTIDLDLDGTGGLLTPPDSHHKRPLPHSSADDTVNAQDEARVAPASVKRRRVTSSAPQPNPPLAPFPTPSKNLKLVQRLAGVATPPITPTTADTDARKRIGVPATPESSNSNRRKAVDEFSPWKKADALPPHLANLLALHKSFDLALSLHVATHPPVLPPLDTSSLGTHEYGLKSIDVELEALTNYVALKPIVEKSCGKRFGLSELKRLMWLWQWNPEEDSLSAGTEDDSLLDDDVNPFTDNPVRGPSIRSKSSNLTACYNITPTRTIDSTTSRRVHTYGFGIRITLTPREAASYCNTLHGGSDSYGNAGKAVGAVARWSAGSEARCKEVEERLWAWVDRHAELLDEHSKSDAPATPSATDHKVPHIPCATLPQLQPAVGNLMPAFCLTAPVATGSTSPSGRLALVTGKSSPSSLSRSASGGLLPPPAFRDVHQKLQAAAGSAGGTLDGTLQPSPLSNGLGNGSKSVEEDVFGPVLMISKSAKSAPTGSAEDRQRALFERIKARSNKDSGSSLSRPAIRGGRLGMMNNLSKSQMQDELKRRSTLSRLEGVAEAVWMFFSLAPSNTASMGSPGSSPRAKRRAFPVSEVIDVVVKSSKTPISGPEAYDSLVLLTQLCPSFLVLRTIARQEWLEMPTSTQVVSSPGNRLNLAGPASPGKVMVRGGGGSLREVRERIRKELGDL